MALDTELFALVKRENLTAVVYSRYSLPSRTYFSRTALPDLKKKWKKKLKEMLHDVDCWFLLWIYRQIPITVIRL